MAGRDLFANDAPSATKGRDLFASEQAAPETQKEPAGFIESVGLGMSKRGLGIIQLGLDAADMAGLPVQNLQDAGKRAAHNLDERGRGSGVAGFAGEMFGDPLTYLGGGEALAAKGLKGLAVSGALTGGAAGATTPLQEGDSRTLNTAAGAVIGTVAAPILSVGGNLAGKPLNYIANKSIDVGGAIKRGASSLMNSGDMAVGVDSGMTVNDIRAAVQSMGEDAIQSFNQSIKSGLSPELSYINTKAQQKGVQLTGGQLTQSPAQQRLEDMAQQEALGSHAYDVANQRKSANEIAMRDYAGELGSLATDAPAGAVRLDNTSVASSLSSEANNKAFTAKSAARNLIDEGKLSKANAPLDYVAGLGKEMRDGLKDDFPLQNMPGISARLDDLDKYTALHQKLTEKARQKELQGVTLSDWGKSGDPAFGGDGSTRSVLNVPANGDRPFTSTVMQGENGQRVSVGTPFEGKKALTYNGFNLGNPAPAPAKVSVNYKALDALRQRIWNTPTSTDAEDAARKALYWKYSDKLYDMVNNDIIQGDAAGIQKLREGQALYRDYKKTWFGADGKSNLGQIVSKNLTDAQVANFFGSSVWGAPKTQGFVRDLKNALGENSDAVNQARGLFLNRILGNGLENSDTPIGTKILSNVNAFKQKNKALYGELFPNDLQKEIEDYARIAHQMSYKQKSQTNPSGSGMFLMAQANRLLSKLPIAGEFASELLKVAGQSGKASRAIKSINEPLRRLGSDSSIISDSLKRIGGASGAILPMGIEKGGGSSVTIDKEPIDKNGYYQEVTPQSQMMTVPSLSGIEQPRGVRNNNPFNLRGDDDWRGKKGADNEGFAQFSYPTDGLRAGALNLVNQQKKHGVRNIRQLITKYAPPHENDTEAYIKNVAKFVGFTPNQDIQLTNKATLSRVMTAILTQEQGKHPYTQEMIKNAATLALKGN